LNVNADERQVLIDLRVELGRRVRICGGCGGKGWLIRSPRPCPLCRAARDALEVSGAMLMPSRDAVDRPRR